MIVVMQLGASKDQVSAVIDSVKAMKLTPHVIQGEERTVVAIVGDERSAFDRDALGAMEGVERIMAVLAPYKIASREVHPANTVIPLNKAAIGDRKIMIIAGPGTADSRDQILETARALKTAGADALYFNVFGPGMSPYAAPGLGEKGLDVLAEAREQTGLPIVTEVTEPELVPAIARCVDLMLVGGNNMQNFPLLNAVGESQHSVLVKRGMVNTMEELLMAAEYILSHGNRQVVLCESGIRTYESYTRNTTFDVNAVPVLKQKTHLPILVDASRAAGRGEFVASIAKGAVASGADGLIIDVDSASAPSDAEDSRGLNVDGFARLIKDLRRVAQAVDRTI